MADPKDKPKPTSSVPSRRALLGASPPPPPPQALRTFLNLTAAPDPAYRFDPNKPPMQPYVPTPGQLRAQAGLMGLADLVRGLTVGASDEKDTNAAQIGELIQTGLPLVKGAGLGLAAMQGGLKILKGAETAEEAAQAARRGIRAYHGSPHDFDKFDISKIGTGEGAQAYGHGLYFAEGEDTARYYKNALGQSQFEIDGVRMMPAELSEHIWKNSEQAASSDFLRGVMQAVDEMTATGKVPSVPTDLKNWASPGGGLTREAWETQKQGYAHAAQHLARAKPTVGKMYEVNINADPEHFIDWDQPLSEQRPVMERLRALAHERAVADARLRITPEVAPPFKGGEGWLEELFAGVTPEEAKSLESAIDARLRGEDITAEAEKQLAAFLRPGQTWDISGRELYANLGEGPRAAERLREAGIPGIRYLDQASRGVPAQVTTRLGQIGARVAGGLRKRTYNYVAFDDALIDILRKYGWLPPIAGLGALSQIDKKAVEQRPQ